MSSTDVPNVVQEVFSVPVALQHCQCLRAVREEEGATAWQAEMRGMLEVAVGLQIQSPFLNLEASFPAGDGDSVVEMCNFLGSNYFFSIPGQHNISKAFSIFFRPPADFPSKTFFYHYFWVLAPLSQGVPSTLGGWVQTRHLHLAELGGARQRPLRPRR